MSDETARPGPVDLSREPDFHIGMLEVRPSTREVIRGSQREILEPKAMQVLVVLQQAAGRVVSRDDLIARCWEGRIVGEDAINRVIWRLRRFSEADGGADFTIETIPKVGYRLPPPPEKKAPAAAPQTVPPVVPGALPGTEHTAPPAAYDNAPEPAPSNLLYRHRLAAAAAALLVAAALALAVWLPLPVRPVETSVAVLPFVNLSGDPKQEFFSDGITEEITSALAKVPDLKVIGRASAFQFKVKDRDLAAMGQALHVTYLIEGSVRKDGDQVRITAQLIKTGTGLVLWTESYNRELKGIFVVQEDIATAITAALRVPLGLTRGERLVANRTSDLDAYQQYLHALALFRARKIDDARALLKQVVARDPGFAPAWGLLAATSTVVVAYRPVAEAVAAGSTREARLLVQSISNRAEQAAHEAIRLDPRLARGYNALGTVQGLRGNWAGYEDYVRQARTLDPDDPDILYTEAFLLGQTGRLKQAQQVQAQILAQEPFVPNYRRQAAEVLWILGHNDTSIEMLEALNSDGALNITLAKEYATAGRYGQAADALLAVPASRGVSRKGLEDAARILRSAPAKVSAPDSLPELGRELNWVYLFVGAQDRSLLVFEREFAAGYYGDVLRDIWASPSASLRKTEHFKAFVRKAHLVEYWRARGWPDLCHPVGTDDFACK